MCVLWPGLALMRHCLLPASMYTVLLPNWMGGCFLVPGYLGSPDVTLGLAVTSGLAATLGLAVGLAVSLGRGFPAFMTYLALLL